MAKPNVNVRVELNTAVTLTLDETQCRALDALVGYGIDDFLKVFYEKLGKSYMQPHERGLRELFQAIQVQVRPALSEIEWHRRAVKLGVAELTKGNGNG